MAVKNVIFKLLDLKNMRLINGEEIFGVDVGPQTQCTHWHSALDIIAVKFKCCGRWYPCFECHRDIADHDPEVWPVGEFDENAILCGACGHRLTINEYMNCASSCPMCSAKFNPGCANHYHLYFEIDSTPLSMPYSDDQNL